MIYIIIFMLCTIVVDSYAMEQQALWIKTTDNHLIEIDEAIAQQSNLLTILQEKYAGTQNNPIPIPINQKSFAFFCSHLTTSAQQLLKQLTDENYSLLMDITEKLRCPIFYTELIDQLLQEKNLSNGLALELVKMIKLKRTIYEQYHTKKYIKKKKDHEQSSHPQCSHDGNYFLETTLNHKYQTQVALWNAQKLTCIKEFPDYNTAQFSPNSDYVILSRKTETGRGTEMFSLLYSIVNDSSVTLASDYPHYLYYPPIISPNGHYIVQKIEGDQFVQRHILLHYNKHKNIIVEIKLGDDFNATKAFAFCSDNKHMLYITKDGLVQCTLNAPYRQQIITQVTNPYDCYNISTNESFLLSLSSNSTKKLFIIENDTATLIKELNGNYNMKSLIIPYPSKKIIYYNSDISTLCIMDEQGNQIASYTPKNNTDYITGIATDTTGNYLVSHHSRKNNSDHLIRSTLIFWNLSNINSCIPGIKRNTQKCIRDIAFTKDGLLITQGIKTELWDMDGDKVLSLGKSNFFFQDFSTNSILTAQNSANLMQRSSDYAWRSMPTTTKIYCSQVNTHAAKAILEEIKTSLTPSQALSFNTYYTHTKENKECVKKFYPNMPDGRALASFNKKHTFLTKKFKLHKHNFTPKTQLIFPPKRHLHEQQQSSHPCSQ